MFTRSKPSTKGNPQGATPTLSNPSQSFVPPRARALQSSAAQESQSFLTQRAPADSLRANTAQPQLESRAGGGSSRQDSATIRQIALEGARGSGGKLPHFSKIQKSFGGFSIGGIRAYSGQRATAHSEAIGAEAYAIKDKVVFSAHNPDLHTAAHEATHVLQQNSGVRLKNGVGEVGDPYERQAEAVAAAVVRGESAESLFADGPVANTGMTGPVQVQRSILIGKEPKVPNNFRIHTRTHYDTSQIAFGSGPFSTTQRASVIADNTAKANMPTAAPAPVTPGGTLFLKSDEDSSSLLPPVVSRTVAPEVDHIVPVTDGGANSLSNARVLSKQQNTAGPAGRPNDTLAQTVVRLYNDYDVTEGGAKTSYADGDRLTKLTAINQFYEYATKGFSLTKLSDLDETEITRIVKAPLDKTRSGIKIE